MDPNLNSSSSHAPKAQGDSRGSDHLTDNNLAKEAVIERRPFFIPITQDELDEWDVDFLMGDEKEVRSIVKPMCHSLRYWLADKFCPPNATVGKKKSGALSQRRICELLGIKYKAFIYSKGKHKLKTFADFNGYSPLEDSNMKRCTQYAEIMEHASNLDHPIITGMIAKKENRNNS